MAEIISDPDFATFGARGSKWSVQTHQFAVMTASLHDSILRLEVSNARGVNWHGELRYSPFSVVVDDVFTVTFSVRAAKPFTFSVWLGQRDDPYKSLVSAENHFGEKVMTPDWQTFTHTWRAVLTEECARLNFVFGQIDNSIEIRDVRLERLPKPSAKG